MNNFLTSCVTVPFSLLLGKVAGLGQDCPKQATLTFTAEKHYLNLPVKNGANNRMIVVKTEDREVYRFDIELAVGDMSPDYFAAMDLSRWTGKTLTLDGGKFLGGNKAFARVAQAEQLPGSDGIYREKNRPQFHFTSCIGWLNDPNGLVYHEGEWHLFYQHNPYGTKWGNMHWGHAVSKDLLHWTELGDVIYQFSDCKAMAFSGSAIIDHSNSSGFGKDGRPPLVIALTDTGAGESIGYSNDKGRTFTMFAGNPVVKHSGRDPKLIWHEHTRRWVMVVYDEFEKKNWAAFYSSADLKTWEYQSRLEGYYECTDLFELPVIGEVGKTCWVIYAADGKYALGQFNGKIFTPEHEGKFQLWHGNFYAAQTYDNVPCGRRVQIGWGKGISFPGMPFSEQMVVPVELSLHSTLDGIRMFAEPVAELKTLRGKGVEFANMPLTDASANLAVEGEGLDVEAEFEVSPSSKINLDVYNSNVNFDAAALTLEVNGLKASLKPSDGKIKLRVLVDSGSIEVFGNGGQVAISKAVLMDKTKTAISVTGSDAIAVKVAAWPLSSIWT
jgi:fructan beta-fructosidase